jgi:S-adenosylhomocysteine hydrolase
MTRRVTKNVNLANFIFTEYTGFGNHLLYQMHNSRNLRHNLVNLSDTSLTKYKNVNVKV